MGIRIVALDGRVPHLGRLITLRIVPMWLVPVIPVVGSLACLVDVLFIFRRDRRCLHDLLAGTEVVRA